MRVRDIAGSFRGASGRGDDSEGPRGGLDGEPHRRSQVAPVIVLSVLGLVIAVALLFLIDYAAMKDRVREVADRYTVLRDGRSVSIRREGVALMAAPGTAECAGMCLARVMRKPSTIPDPHGRYRRSR